MLSLDQWILALSAASSWTSTECGENYCTSLSARSLSATRNDCGSIVWENAPWPLKFLQSVGAMMQAALFAYTAVINQKNNTRLSCKPCDMNDKHSCPTSWPTVLRDFYAAQTAKKQSITISWTWRRNNRLGVTLCNSDPFFSDRNHTALLKLLLLLLRRPVTTAVITPQYNQRSTKWVPCDSAQWSSEEKTTKSFQRDV